jgi:Tfp pilus assembly protein PilV
MDSTLLNRNISTLGLSEEQINSLTTNAKQLSYENLIELGHVALSGRAHEKPDSEIVADFAKAHDLELTIEDTRSIQDAFAASAAKPQMELTGAACCCCTCTPCCSCCA